MNTQVRITYRDVIDSEDIRSFVTKHFNKLAAQIEPGANCDVVIEKPHKSQHKGLGYRVRVSLNGLKSNFVVTKEGGENITATLGAVFQVLTRQVHERYRSNKKRTSLRYAA